jgi:uncharacterized protein YdhG (YjbR/CyaY superfamily)
MPRRIPVARNSPDAVEQHLAGFTARQRKALEATRSSLLRLLPGAEEVLAWGMPSYRIDGDLVLSFSGFADHNSLFPGPGVVEEMRTALPEYETTKGTIHLPRDSAPPVAALRTVVRARIEEINAGYPKSSGVTKAFYDNGHLKHRGRMKDGRMHGAWEFFRRDGSPMRSGTFDRGEQVGLWTTFDRSGSAHRVTDFG